MHIFIAIIGYLAGFLAIVTFIPQAMKTWKTQDTKQITLLTYILYNTANIIFFLFGVLSVALPIMHPVGTSQALIIVWGLTLIIPYTATITATFVIIWVKVKNIRKYQEPWSAPTKKEGVE